MIEVNVDTLRHAEVCSIIKLMDRHNLWQERKKFDFKKKLKFIKKDCKSQVKNILLSIFSSNAIKSKLDSIIQTIYSNKTAKEIFIVSTINTILDLDLLLDDIFQLLSINYMSSDISTDPNFKEIVEFNKNRPKIKSSIFAKFILKNYDFNNSIIDTLIKIMKKLDKIASSRKLMDLQFTLISFSNIELLLGSSTTARENLIRYYEHIKNLNYCSNSLFFWIQYANARISQNDFEQANICLNNALGCSDFKENGYQYDSCKARYLIENQMYHNKSEDSYNVFKEAHDLIINNRNSVERWHFPLKQTNLYPKYYYAFYNSFSEEEKGFFYLNCLEIIKKIEVYFNIRKEMKSDVNVRIMRAHKEISDILHKIK